MGQYDAAYKSEESGDWLKAADFPRNMETILVIASHEGADFTKAGEEPKPPKCGIRFEGKDAGVVLNTQNLTRMKEAFGDDSDDWIGKEVSVTTELIPNGQFAGNYMFVVKPVSETADADDIPF